MDFRVKQSKRFSLNTRIYRYGNKSNQTPNSDYQFVSFISAIELMLSLQKNNHQICFYMLFLPILIRDDHCKVGCDKRLPIGTAVARNHFAEIAKLPFRNLGNSCTSKNVDN